MNKKFVYVIQGLLDDTFGVLSEKCFDEWMIKQLEKNRPFAIFDNCVDIYEDPTLYIHSSPDGDFILVFRAHRKEVIEHLAY